MHPLLRPARRIVPCIIVHRISQLSPHVLIQSMRTSFCICRLMNRQNKGYNYQMWAMDARRRLLCVILSNEVFHSPALFSLLIPVFRGRNQRFIKKCTLRWTIAGYRPQCEVSSKVSWNSLKYAPESGHGKSPNSYSWTKKKPIRIKIYAQIYTSQYIGKRLLCQQSSLSIAFADMMNFLQFSF